MGTQTLCLLIFSSAFLATALGNCDVSTFETQQNFNVSQFQGEWYAFMYLRRPDWFGVPLPTDYFIDLKEMENYIQRDVLRRKPNEDCCSKRNTKLYKTDEPAIFEREFTWNRTDNITNMYRVSLSVVSTDYDGYFILYGCSDTAEDGSCGRNDTWSEIFTRSTTNVDATMNQTIQTKVQGLCLKTEDYDFVVQTYDCKTGKKCEDNGAAGTVLLDVFLIGAAILIQRIIHL